MGLRRLLPCGGVLGERGKDGDGWIWWTIVMFWTTYKVE